MGGEFGLTSRQGKGSTFWFTAWLERGAPLPVFEAKEIPRIRILVVDGIETSRVFLSTLLEEWNLEHSEALCAQEALDRLRYAVGQGKPYGVALIDCHLPGISGFELAGMIKSDPAIRQTHLIIL